MNLIQIPFKVTSGVHLLRITFNQRPYLWKNYTMCLFLGIYTI